MKVSQYIIFVFINKYYCCENIKKIYRFGVLNTYIMNKRHIFIILLVCLFPFIQVFKSNAQITIGSLEPPVDGSLLQLKNIDGIGGDGANATGGLLLPRVELTDYLSLDDIEVGLDKDSHVGLIVYNLNKCLLGKGDDEGLYVWDGSRWNQINQKEKKVEDVRTILDNGLNMITLSYKDESNTYYYGDFGDAGFWMTENLKTKYLPDGDEINTIQITHSQKLIDMRYIEVSHAGTSTFFYTIYSALNGMVIPCDFDQGTIDSSKPGLLEVENIGYQGGDSYKYIQGICPKGWHVPSDREWNLLEKELTNNGSKYTIPTYVVPTHLAWNDNWNIVNGFRGEIQFDIMQVGNSKLPEDGGFYAILYGVFSINYASIVDPVMTYTNGHIYEGRDAGFWTSSKFSADNYYVRWFRQLNNDALRSSNSISEIMHPIRCKRN